MPDREPIPKLFALLAAIILALGVAACGDDDDEGGGGTGGKRIESNPANAGVEITIGSKNFTEQYLLGEVYAQALEAAGYTVKKELNLSSEQDALRALEAGEISGYPEYASTALTSFFSIDLEEVPNDPAEAADQLQALFKKRGLVAFEPAPFNRANTVGLLTSTADELTVEKLTDLEGKTQDLTLYGPPECSQRADCLVALEEGYGFQFAEFKPVDIELRHTVLEDGRADLSIVITTDAKQFTSPAVYTTLDDDLGVFPAGNPVLVARQQVVDEAGPDFQATIEKVQQGLTLEAVQEMNGLVNIDGGEPAAVARAYLQEVGFIE